MTKAKYIKLKKFFSQFPVHKYSKGQIILKPGDKFEYVYFNKSGFGRAYTITPKGESTINLFRPLFTMSVIHFVSNHRNDFYFQALTPVEVYAAPYSEFKKFIGNDKQITLDVMDFFFGSLLNYFVNQGNIINGNALSKIASVLLQLTHDYGTMKNDKLIVNFPATHRVIANLVGLTRETTSVQMSKLQKSGAVTTKRSQFVVNDLEKLKKISEQSN
ncbi:MAG TPA: Crp/Fnr family transcriptional regulator [Candidatus Woesebacteria bacterium]|nr:Crp/Fnr family transcriptional regulator [Candidatus Woesebacteria bacterium]